MILALALACDGGRIDPSDEHAAGPQWTSIEGTLDIDYTVGSFVVCDGTVSFTGVPYTGECEGCEFAFEIDAELERDEGTVACPWIPMLTLYTTGTVFTDPIVLGLEDRSNGVPDAIRIGATWSEYDYTYFVPFEDGEYGPVSIEHSRVEWMIGTMHYAPGEAVLGSRYPTGNPCTADYLQYEEQGPYGTGNTVYGTLACQKYGSMDVFEFEGVEGGVAYLTADMTADDATLLTTLAVYGPESCVEAAAFGNFACSKGDLPCPAMSIATDPGTYVAVLAGVFCKGDATYGSYRFDLDATWDPQLDQTQDDLPVLEPSTLAVSASATLAE